uniref:60S ribosomal protein L41 n=1 Tax=Ditylenchus dipsaci TaxID=166011 RepID=A0A915EL07_9BILA
MKDYKGTHVPVITFAVKDSDEKMEVLQTALELYFNKFKNHINCVKDHCYNAKADILFELIKADVKYIGCQVRYSKTGGISPKMNVKAVVYCETDPPVNVSTSTTKQEIELYKQHENSCAEIIKSGLGNSSSSLYPCFLVFENMRAKWRKKRMRRLKRKRRQSKK